MKPDNLIPSFVTSFVEADRILSRQREEKPTDKIQAASLLFRSYELILLELLASAEIPIGDRWSLGKLSQEVFSKIDFPPELKEELTEVVQHRNMLAHAHPAVSIPDSFLITDLHAIRKLALWYLQNYYKGPKLNAQAAGMLLKGENFTLPKAVFISYAREDQSQANHLYDTLINRGHKPWMDKRDLIAGQNWESEIRRAIEKADFFIALMSSKSVTKRGFVQKEIRFALDILGEIPPGRIYFIPARLEICEVPDIIKHLHWVDLQKDEDYSQILQAIEHE
ncbi:MAG: toll/interleukin-1 receptor domain-containing protein [Anaerolineales bacterium]|jgi:hypothetical protein|nr:MAG: toll/interleukin-1 receptor domain-containing protein [Anaerolineales bacterium]